MQMNNFLKLKAINLGKHKRFVVDFIIIPFVFLGSAYFVFNKFMRINFLLDDIDYLVGLKDLVNTIGGYGDFIHTYSMRPVAFKPMSLGIDWLVNFKLFGLNFHYYHLFNIIVLSANAFFLYLLIRTCFRLRFAGLVISFCYLVHPFNIDGMVWISGGFTSQNVILFTCLTLIMYYLYLEKSKTIFLALSYLSFMCAFLSREDVIMLPLVMVFFLLFIGRMSKVRIKELLGYLVIAIFFLGMRVWLLYPNVVEVYRWNFTNIPNLLLRSKYYMGIALGPVKELFFQPVFSMKYKILLILFKIILYSLIPFIAYKVYKYRRSSEVKLFIFGLIWYFFLSIPFVFMFGKEFLHDRYISLSIIGLLIAQIALITVLLKSILKNSFLIKFLLLFFSFAVLLICNSMITKGFNRNYWTRYSANIQCYIAQINLETKNNPAIRNIELVGFPVTVNLPYLLRQYPEYKNLNFVDTDKEGHPINKGPTLVIRFKEALYRD
jgi:Dolichyl-phosphate-mannose-protein mannosyltransferase